MLRVGIETDARNVVWLAERDRDCTSKQHSLSGSAKVRCGTNSRRASAARTAEPLVTAGARAAVAKLQQKDMQTSTWIHDTRPAAYIEHVLQRVRSLAAVGARDDGAIARAPYFARERR